MQGEKVEQDRVSEPAESVGAQTQAGPRIHSE